MKVFEFILKGKMKCFFDARVHTSHNLVPDSLSLFSFVSSPSLCFCYFLGSGADDLSFLIMFPTPPYPMHCAPRPQLKPQSRL